METENRAKKRVNNLLILVCINEQLFAKMDERLVAFSCLAFCVSVEMTDASVSSNLMIVINWCSCFPSYVPNSGAIFESYFKMRAGSVPS